MLSGKGKRKPEISSVGYTTRTIEIVLNDSIVNLDIELDVETKTLGDVVVISVGSLRPVIKQRELH